MTEDAERRCATGARTVLATLPHIDELLTLRTSAGPIVTTEDHKYWNATDRQWQESQHLDPGDRLLTLDDAAVTVAGRLVIGDHGSGL